jgi:hydrogenase expression/formation protein HypC
MAVPLTLALSPRERESSRRNRTMCLGIPGRILEVFERDELPMGKVEFGGIAKDVCLAYTPEVKVGDYVIVHVGFAISQVDEREAQEIFSYLEQIDEVGSLQDGPEKPDGEASP